MPCHFTSLLISGLSLWVTPYPGPSYVSGVPPLPFIPQIQQGKLVFAILLCYTGDLAEGEQVVAPLRALGTPIAHLVAPMPFPAIFPRRRTIRCVGLRTMDVRYSLRR